MYHKHNQTRADKHIAMRNFECLTFWALLSAWRWWNFPNLQGNQKHKPQADLSREQTVNAVDNTVLINNFLYREDKCRE